MLSDFGSNIKVVCDGKKKTVLIDGFEIKGVKSVQVKEIEYGELQEVSITLYPKSFVINDVEESK